MWRRSSSLRHRLLSPSPFLSPPSLLSSTHSLSLSAPITPPSDLALFRDSISLSPPATSARPAADLFQTAGVFSFTPLVLYLSFTSAPVPSSQTLSITQFSVPSPVIDKDEAEFASPLGDGRRIAGFVICFPNYSTFLAKPGLYIEDIFVREPWRRMGLGKFMLSSVAKKAAELGMGRVEWCVLDWNVNAIEFYKGMGAEVFQEWRICRLTGPSLEKYKDE